MSLTKGKATSNIVALYTLGGVGLGCLFPLAAWWLDLAVHGLPWLPSLIWQIHLANPVHWIVDMAPLVLGAFAYQIGRRERAETVLRRSEARLHSVFETVADGIVVIDSRGTIEAFNPAAEQIFGYAAGEVLGQNIKVLMPPPHREAHHQYISNYLTTGVKKMIGIGREVEGQRKGGDTFPMGLAVSEIRVGRERKFTGIVRDVTERKQADVERKEAEMALGLANEKLTLWVGELEQRNKEIAMLNELSEFLQSCMTVEEAYNLIGRLMPRFFPGMNGALYWLQPSQNLLEVATTWGDWPAAETVFAPDDCWALRRGRLHLVQPDSANLLCPHLGNTRPAACLCMPLTAQGGAIGVLHLHFAADGHDETLITESQPQLVETVADNIALALANLKLRESLRTQSIRDPLTGLFNRRYLEETLERELRRAARNHHPVGVIMLDIDHFKHFNDTFGHEAGDTLLCELGNSLKSNIRAEDIACRYGGEEFTVVMPGASLEITRQRAEHLRERSGQLRVQHRGEPLGAITLSLGVAVFPEHGSASEAVLRAADGALYRAKREGRNRVAVGSVSS